MKFLPKRLLSSSYVWITVVLCAIVIYLLLTPAQVPLPPEAARELDHLSHRDLPRLIHEEELEPSFSEALQNILTRFEKTGRADAADPNSGLGILHLAALFKKPALVAHLLQQGVHANRLSHEGASPLLLAVSTQLTPGIPSRQVKQTLDALLDSGASFSEAEAGGGAFLTQAAFSCEDEEVLLYLMQRGARTDSSSALPAALHGWDSLLRAILEKEPDTQGLLHAAALGSCRYAGNHAECLELLLAKGADVNAADSTGTPGTTPLFRLTEELSLPEPPEHQTDSALDAADFLLRHGADPYLRAEADEEYPGFCPYDFLARRPELLSKLALRGHALQAPPLRFGTGTTLAADVCRAALAHPSAEELEAHFSDIATLLTPSPTLQEQEIYPHALEAAIHLLARVDASRTAESTAASPLWRSGPSEARSALLRALRTTPTLTMPRILLCNSAEAWAAEGQADDAATAAELLGRCPDAEEDLARYCHGESRPLQAGAYAARLAAAGLPDARDGGVADWLAAHGRTADSDFLREALLLTSLEELWFGRMNRAEQKKLFALMRRIGAPRAAELYERIARNLDRPEQLDAIVDQGDATKYELEVATARFFLEHKDEFTTPGT